MQQVRPHSYSYETEAIPIHPCDGMNDRQYVKQYSAEIRSALLGPRCQRQAGWIARRPPDTDKISIPSPEEAATALLAAAGRYYVLSRCHMPQETRRALDALRLVLHDPYGVITALSDVLPYFIHSMAVIEDGQLHDAVRAAQLSLRTLQSTWAELPAVNSDSWLLDRRGEV